MERRTGIGSDQAAGSHEHASERVVSSRWRALSQLHTAVESGSGPVLVTGEAGAGKSWLVEKLAGELASSWEVARVDLSSALDAVDFLRLIGHDLGVSSGAGVGDLRIRLRRALHDDADEGRHWLLLIDEAHRGTPPVWDEVQAIVNQLGRQSGFAAVVILGQTELLNALSQRAMSGLTSSLGLHVHLMPLDLDEARDLLGIKGPADPAVETSLGELHRDARGNPALLRRLAPSWPGLSPASGPTSAKGGLAQRPRSLRTCRRSACRCSAMPPKPKRLPQRPP